MFEHGIAHIVGISAKPEMVRIDTGGLIAAMEHEQAQRNRAFRDGPRVPMREGELFSSYSETSIALTNAMGSPPPACVRFLDVTPETVL